MKTILSYKMYENKTIPAGTKIVIGVNAGFAGTDSISAYILTQDYTEDELSDIAWQACQAWQEGVDHAESYGVYPYPDEYIDEEDDTEYSSNIEGWWEIYDEKKHAGKCMYGNQQEVQFVEM